MATKRQQYSNENLQKAVQAINEDNISLGDASKIYQVPKSTLHKYIKFTVVVKQRPEPDPILTEDEEEGLQAWCFELAKRGFPVTNEDLLDEVQKIILADGRSTPFKDGRPTETKKERLIMII